MLKITIPGIELFDSATYTFSNSPDTELEFEHNLLAISKWESIWEKPLLGPEKLTSEETVSYLHCMLLTPDVPPEVFNRITEEQQLEINAYIEKKMTATWGLDLPDAPKNQRVQEIVTSELIYYWMLSLNIPKECENWHLARLITLIRVTNKKNAPPKKTNAKTLAEQRRQLNAQRQAQHNTKG